MSARALDRVCAPEALGQAARSNARSSSRRRRAAGFAQLLWPLLAVGCAAPRGLVHAEPPSARLFLDGREQPAAAVHSIEVPYYGVVDLLAMPDGTTDDAASPGRATWSIEPPVTPWIFPADFLVETILAGVLPDAPSTAQVTTTARDHRIERGVIPPSAVELRGRAATMVEAR